MTKQIKKLFIFVILACLMLTATGISEAAVTEPEHAGALWTRHFSDNYFVNTSMTSTPVVTSDHVYVVNKDDLYALQRSDGSTDWSIKLSGRMNSVCDPALSGSRLFIPLSSGIIECVDTIEKKSIWVSEKHCPDDKNSYQTLGRLTLHEGQLYAGVWAQTARVSSDSEVASDGEFFCIDAEDGHTVWRYRANAGFYWTQAVIVKNRVFFTSEDGLLISHDTASDTVYETRALTSGRILRCGLGISDDKKNIYTISKDGMVFKISLGDNAEIIDVNSTSLLPAASEKGTVNCTSTPVMYEDRLYFGCFADGYGYFYVLDAATLKPIFRAMGPKNGEIKSKPLIIPDGSRLNIYFTANTKDGSLYIMTVDKNSSSGVIKTLFTPYSDKQYCLSNAVTDSEGVIYYSNDSGTLFAVGVTDISADITLSPPDNIRIIPKKKKWIIRWNTSTLPAGSDKKIKTIIYIKRNNNSHNDKEKWIKYKTTKKNQITIKRNNKNTNSMIRMRSCIESGSKQVCSKYSKELILKSTASSPERTYYEGK